MPTKGDGAIASLDWSEEERRKLAALSLTYKCDKVCLVSYSQMSLLNLHRRR